MSAVSWLLSLWLAAASGLVVDGAGRPVAGAVVLARGGPVAVRAVAGVDGRFWLLPLAPKTTYGLRASHPGFATAQTRLAAQAPSAARLAVRLVLRREATAFGRVADDAGNPVGGATVVLLASGDGRHLGAQALTNGTGRFEIDRLDPGTWDLAVQAESFAPVRVRGVAFRPAESGEPVDLGTVVLRPGFSLRGEVVDPAGRAVAGARVRALPASAAEAGRAAALTPSEDRADSHGRFHLENLEAGAVVVLAVDHAGYAPLRSAPVAAPAERLRLTLAPAVRVSGRVRDRDGHGIAGARVLLVRGADPVLVLTPTGAPEESATTDDDGKFEVPAARPGKVRLIARAAGYLPSRGQSLDLATGDATGLDVVLDAGATLEGTVRSASGLPLPGAWVRLAEVERGEAAGGEGTVTDERGTYRLTAVPLGPQRIAAGDDEHPQTLAEVTVAAGENHLDLRLDGGQTVSGRVVDLLGLPVPDAVVRLRGSRSLVGRSDPAGGFAIPAVPPGNYALEGERAGFATSRASHPVAVGEDAVAGLVVTLAPGGGISGQVLGARPADWPRIEVRGRGPLGERVSRLDFSGRYRLADLAPGLWTVEVVLQSQEAGVPRAIATVALEPGAAESVLDLVLTPSP